jgi:hypothetical protein
MSLNYCTGISFSGYGGCFPGLQRPGRNVTTHLHLLPLYAFMQWTGNILSFFIFYSNILILCYFELLNDATSSSELHIVTNAKHEETRMIKMTIGISGLALKEKEK